METEHITGIKEIISQLGDEELWGLTKTVTQGLLKDKIQSRDEAISAIINYSPDSKSILKRKVVTRELLFSYLHQNQIPVVMPISKEELIGMICSHWNTQKTIQLTTVENPNVQQSTQLDINMLALQFSEWFYSMINLNVPIALEHFWHDSKLKLILLSQNQHKTEELVYGPSAISRALFKIKIEYNLYFNPNCLKDGVKGHVDPHGLVAVLVCGTLHSNNICVGVFEQVFMLARDPFSENNWKIKSTELNLRSKENVQGPPQLCDSNLTNALM
ncbi:hypothetical protein RI129_008950 [Pyrocoelia pectoralis]|uniref:NTF2 domain-containing protein n=1 Tax=Pyrocoelia pectoralis TaxID=417401 RepID=A0AAN7VCE4_9COLE